MRIVFVFGLLGALAASSAVGQHGQRTSPAGLSACQGASWPDRILGLTPQGDLTLASGRLARLTDLRLPPDPPYREAALTWLQSGVERSLLLQGSDIRDRWNRISVQLHPDGDSGAADIAGGLVGAGLALVDPGTATALCRQDLLALEANARKRSLGLWADARYNPIDVGQANRLHDRVGSFVLVEGHIRTVGMRPRRTYLNFGGHWAEDFTIIIPQKTWKLMADRGLGAEALEGRRIRARGILQSWQGTALTIVVPEMIEILEGGDLPR